ncbi:hypothetical protein ABPG75_008994 [Micractinium tetrahymenae]
MSQTGLLSISTGPPRTAGARPASEKELEQACTAALVELEALLQDSNHCPHFLPRCKAVILCSTLKAGMGLGLELGSGVLLARLPPAPPAALPASASSKSVEAWSPKSSSSLGCPSPRGAFSAGGAGGEAARTSLLASPAALPASPSSIARSSRWSAPCFVHVGALSAGLVLGASRASLAIGLLTDEALQRLERGQALAVGQEFSVCLMDGESDCTASLGADLCVCKTTRGLMVDINVQSLAVRVNGRRNRRVYGAGASAADLLRGAVPLPPAAGPLSRRLSHVEMVSLAAAFEPSHDGSEGAGCAHC